MDTFNILYRNIKLRFDNLITIFITIIQPMIWLVLYSKIASQTMKNTGIENYTAFILPGLIILVCLGVSASVGMMNFIMKNNRSFYRILIAPIKRSSIVLGQVLEGVLCSFLEVGIMIVLSLFLGVKIVISFKTILTMVFLIGLAAFFMSSLAYSISLSLPNEIIYETIMNAIVLPLFFMSSALFPVEEITGLLKWLIKLNPFTHMINLLREIILTGLVPKNETLLVVILFMVLNLIMFLISNKRLENQANCNNL